MAQQARPKVAGNTDAFRTQPAACSTVVSRKPLGSFSSIPMRYTPVSRTRPVPHTRPVLHAWHLPFCSCFSVPLQAAAAPDVRVGDEDREDEQQHFDEPEEPQGVEADSPGIEEDD